MTIAADLPESAHQQAEAFLATLDEDRARHVAVVGPHGHAVKPVCKPYETLIHAIAYQQLHTKAGDVILGRFIALYPAAASPVPQQMLTADEAALCAYGFSAAELATIRGIAQAALDGIVSMHEQALATPNEVFIKRLVTLRGVDRWMVEMLLIYTLEHSDILPADDFGVCDGYRRLRRLNTTPTRERMETINLARSPYRTVAAWYLWHVPVNVLGS